MPAFESRHTVDLPSRHSTGTRGVTFVEEYLKRCAEHRVEPYYPFIAGAAENIMDLDCEFIPEGAWNFIVNALRTSSKAAYQRIRLCCFENMGPRHPPVQSRRRLPYEALASRYPPRLPPMRIASALISGIANQVMLSALTLTELRLSGVPVGPEGAAKLSRSIALLERLRDLQLDGSGIGNAGVAHLVPVLRRLPSLRSVSLRRCGITSAAGDDLGRLSAGDWASRQWEASLRSTDSSKPPQRLTAGLMSLSLAENSIGDDVVGKILREEASRQHLKWLDLSGTAVTPDAGPVLLRILGSPEDAALSFVDLSNTPAASQFASSGGTAAAAGVHIVLEGHTRCQLMRVSPTSNDRHLPRVVPRDVREHPAVSVQSLTDAQAAYNTPPEGLFITGKEAPPLSPVAETTHVPHVAPIPIVPDDRQSPVVLSLLGVYGRRIAELEAVVAGFAALTAAPSTAHQRNLVAPRFTPAEGHHPHGPLSERNPVTLSDLQAPSGEDNVVTTARAPAVEQSDPVLAPGSIAAAVKQEMESAMEASKDAQPRSLLSITEYVTDAVDAVRWTVAESTARLEGKLVEQAHALHEIQTQLEHVSSAQKERLDALDERLLDHMNARRPDKIVVLPVESAGTREERPAVPMHDAAKLEECIHKLLGNIQSTLGVTPLAADADGSGAPRHHNVDKEDLLSIRYSLPSARDIPTTVLVRRAAAEPQQRAITDAAVTQVKASLRNLGW